jgi:uncharacterized membrane protein
MKTFGFVLIIIGIAMIVIRGISVPTEKNIVDIGPVKIDKKENKWIGWPTYAGIAVMIAGAFVVLSNKNGDK